MDDVFHRIVEHPLDQKNNEDNEKPIGHRLIHNSSHQSTYSLQDYIHDNQNYYKLQRNDQNEIWERLKNERKTNLLMERVSPSQEVPENGISPQANSSIGQQISRSQLYPGGQLLILHEKSLPSIDKGRAPFEHRWTSWDSQQTRIDELWEEGMHWKEVIVRFRPRTTEKGEGHGSLEEHCWVEELWTSKREENPSGQLANYRKCLCVQIIEYLLLKESVLLLWSSDDRY